MTFKCNDACAKWETVSTDSNVSIGLSGVNYTHTTQKECIEWTHTCDCIAGC